MSVGIDRDFLDAVKASNVYQIDMLAQQGANVNQIDKEEKTPLHHAVTVEVVAKLLDLGARQWPDCQGNTPLHIACSNETQQIAQCLINNGAKFVHNLAGSTPFHCACECSDNPSFIKYLLDSGANLMEMNEAGMSPFEIAVMNENHSIIELLIS